MTTAHVEGEYGCVTEVGHVRQHNEDSHLTDLDLGLYIVADGMGGHEAGEVASNLACQAIQSSVREGLDLNAAVHAAQESIKQAVDSGEGAPGMGTTVVVLQLTGRRYRLAWVGDSRAYLWHDGQLRQLSQDHSYVQELIDNHAISLEEAEHHPDKSTLSRCLGGGIEDQLKVDELTGILYRGERIILCTDGVTGDLSDEDIAQVLRTHSELTPAAVAQALVKAALEAGGGDNATALVVTAPDTAADRMSETAPRRSIQADATTGEEKHALRRWALMLVSVVIIIAVAVGIWFTLIVSSPQDSSVLPDKQTSGGHDASSWTAKGHE